MAVSISNCTDLIAAKGGGTVATDMGSVRGFIFTYIQGGVGGYINQLQGQYDAIYAWDPGGGGGGGGK